MSLKEGASDAVYFCKRYYVLLKDSTYITCDYMPGSSGTVYRTVVPYRFLDTHKKMKGAIYCIVVL